VCKEGYTYNKELNMNYWLMKSEPEEYSIVNLRQDKTVFWFGIRNYQVRNMLRDEIRVGDLALFYHSNAGKETGVVGVMKIVSKAYPDNTQFDAKSKYFDVKSKLDNPRWLGVDVRYEKTLERLISLTEIKSNSFFKDIALVRKGSRLSVMPLKEKHFNKILSLASK
jgi:predicted RNA-binding protein with PUA-like domain